MLDRDDRVEAPQGFNPKVIKEHEILNGIPKEWPHFFRI